MNNDYLRSLLGDSTKETSQEKKEAPGITPPANLEEVLNLHEKQSTSENEYSSKQIEYICIMTQSISGESGESVLCIVCKTLDPLKTRNQYQKVELVKQVLTYNSTILELKCHNFLKEFKIDGKWFQLPLKSYSNLLEDSWWEKTFKNYVITRDHQETLKFLHLDLEKKYQAIQKLINIPENKYLTGLGSRISAEDLSEITKLSKDKIENLVKYFEKEELQLLESLIRSEEVRIKNNELIIPTKCLKRIISEKEKYNNLMNLLFTPCSARFGVSIVRAYKY